MTKTKSRIFKALLLAAGIGVGGWIVHPFVAARGSIRIPKGKVVAGGPVISGLQTAWRDLNGRLIPPLGTSSATKWKGLDSKKQMREVEECSCFQSVNYLTTGDRTQCVYRAWPMETLEAVQENSTWDNLEHTLRPGDVVEFVSTVTTSTGGETTNECHAQFCVADGGLMAGANNEPRFRLINGIPSGTNVWDVCTSRQYYLALRAMDEAWSTFGNEHTYKVKVYRHPD